MKFCMEVSFGGTKTFMKYEQFCTWVIFLI